MAPARLLLRNCLLLSQIFCIFFVQDSLWDRMNSVSLKGTRNKHVASHGRLVVQDPKHFGNALRIWSINRCKMSKWLYLHGHACGCSVQSSSVAFLRPSEWHCYDNLFAWVCGTRVWHRSFPILHPDEIWRHRRVLKEGSTQFSLCFFVFLHVCLLLAKKKNFRDYVGLSVCPNVCLFVCLFVATLEPTVLIGTIWIFFRW